MTHNIPIRINSFSSMIISPKAKVYNEMEAGALARDRADGTQ